MELIDNSQKRGFTLVEVLVAASIAIIISAVIIVLYISSEQSFTMGSTFLEIHSGARVAMDWMVKDVRWATQVISTRTIGAQTYTTSANELVLEIPSIDSSGDIIDIDNTYDYIVYHLNDTNPTKLERIVDADAASSRTDENRIIANNVSSLIFSSGGTDLSSIVDVTILTNIAVALSTSRTVLGGRILQHTLNSIAELRNKE